MSREAERVRVFVAEDHPVYRDGLVREIEARPDLALVGESGDGREALERISESAPDVALLDVRMPGLEGPGVLSELHRRGVGTRIVFLSAFLDGAVVYEAMVRGASGYVSKDAERDEICDAVAAVGRGRTAVLSPGPQTAFMEEARAREARKAPALSKREGEVLRLTAEGLSGVEIGQRLFVSRNTVKTHLQRVYDKLGVSNRAAMVAEAMRRGLLE